ncbi:hypothetical protein FO440_14655 [Mucilaginibacter corticis]|uniref:Uncharacterized protein n=1 Tax=Mucilaginibacter corticis TaxID=2597670 RepID=A0A556MMF1_9SPHI|nr:hypothetical protein [Mucilaginibacter corticis]TSJ40972.1 hypothetical protein FO440_14655 [Mucilaginibacter corticis]
MNRDPKEQPAHAIEKDNEIQSRDGQEIENEKDVHELESGNVGEPEAEKSKLDGPANDLVGMPDADDGEPKK